MDLLQHRRKVRFLLSLAVVGVLYINLINFHFSLTGIAQIDGIPGVMLGFYTCSYLVSCYLERFLYGREFLPRNLSRHEKALWWGVNIIVLIIGLQDVVTGILRYSEIK